MASRKIKVESACGSVEVEAGASARHSSCNPQNLRASSFASSQNSRQIRAKDDFARQSCAKEGSCSHLANIYHGVQERVRSCEEHQKISAPILLSPRNGFSAFRVKVLPCSVADEAVEQIGKKSLAGQQVRM